MISVPHPLPPNPGGSADTTAERNYYNITQAAELIGVSRVSIWRWIRDGHLPAARLGHRTTRIKRTDLERLLEKSGPSGSRWRLARGAGAGLTRLAPAGWTRGPEPGRWQASAWEHLAQFYESDSFLLDALSDYIGTALRANDAAIVVATPEHREDLEARLQANGLNLAAVRDAGRYSSVDAADTLARFLVDGAPDPGRFRKIVEDLVARAAGGGRRVAVFSELVGLLAIAGNQAATLYLEQLWNDLQANQAFSLLCAYPMDCLDGGAFIEALGDVCAEHSRVIPAESYTDLTNPDDRLRAIAVLQQKAKSLDTEIAERKRAEARLQAALAAERSAREAAEAALRLRDEFLSVAAHELKTPLTSLSGYAQLVLRRLSREGLIEPAQVVQAMETITGQSAKLSRLLNQLLDISRLEAGKLSLEPQLTDLAALVAQVVGIVQTSSDRHAIALQRPATLMASIDPLRLEQVLTNLLDNAIKYSPAGSPVDVLLTDCPGGVAEVAVRDRGLGIPPEQRGQIFDRFYQAHGNGYRSGLGLGLYICRQIVELHGGEIRAEFPPDGGTCFVVRLPIQRPETDHSSAGYSDSIAGSQDSVGSAR